LAPTTRRVVIDPPLIWRAGNRFGSAIPAAAPRQAAASIAAAAPSAPAAATAAAAASAATAATSTAATAAATPSAATPTSTTAAAAARDLHEAAAAAFLVEDVECRQTDVRDFLFAENEALIGRGVQRLRNVRGRNRGCGGACPQRKTQSGGAEGRHSRGFGQTLPLRSLLHPGHAALLHASVQDGKILPVFGLQREDFTFGSCTLQAGTSSQLVASSSGSVHVDEQRAASS